MTNVAAPLRFDVTNARRYINPNLDGQGVRPLVSATVTIHRVRPLYEWHTGDVDTLLHNLANKYCFFIARNVVFERYGKATHDVPAHVTVPVAVFRKDGPDDVPLLEMEVTAGEYRDAVARAMAERAAWRSGASTVGPTP